MRVVSISQMKQLEKEADLSGLSYYQMMENAGFGAYLFIKDKLNPKSVTVFCGSGNNAGDGFVLARYFAKDNVLCNVVLCGENPKTSDAIKNYELLKDMNVNIFDDFESAKDKINADVFVDAIYGTGFHGKFNDDVRKIAKFINSSHQKKVSLDIPSGINADTSEYDEDALKVDFTLSFDSLKYAHTNKKLKEYMGIVSVIDIKIPKNVHKKVLKE